MGPRDAVLTATNGSGVHLQLDEQADGAATWSHGWCRLFDGRLTTGNQLADFSYFLAPPISFSLYFYLFLLFSRVIRPNFCRNNKPWKISGLLGRRAPIHSDLVRDLEKGSYAPRDLTTRACTAQNNTGLRTDLFCL
jgi:hypothetical protein